MDTLSTTIDTDPGPSAAGAGAPKIADPTPIPSARDDIDAALKEMDAPKVEENPEAERKDEPKADAAPKDEPKAEKDPPKTEEKPEAQPEAKPGAADAAETDDAAAKDGEQKEGKSRHPDAPANFLPRAKELWRNTPNEVKAEVNRVLSEAEKATEAYKRYDDLREFDELAKSNGRDLRESLMKLNHIENTMQQNPIAALNAILAEVGPRKADGQPINIMEVAQFLSQQGPQG